MSVNRLLRMCTLTCFAEISLLITYSQYMYVQWPVHRKLRRAHTSRLTLLERKLKKTSYSSFPSGHNNYNIHNTCTQAGLNSYRKNCQDGQNEHFEKWGGGGASAHGHLGGLGTCPTRQFLCLDCPISHLVHSWELWCHSVRVMVIFYK